MKQVVKKLMLVVSFLTQTTTQSFNLAVFTLISLANTLRPVGKLHENHLTKYWQRQGDTAAS